jgi:hypothetical protein
VPVSIHQILDNNPVLLQAQARILAAKKLSDLRAFVYPFESQSENSVAANFSSILT